MQTSVTKPWEVNMSKVSFPVPRFPTNQQFTPSDHYFSQNRLLLLRLLQSYRYRRK